MSTTQSGLVAPMRLEPELATAPGFVHDAAGLSPAVPGDGWGALRTGDARLDVVLQPARRGLRDSGAVPGGGQRAPGAGCADGGDVGATGGRDAAGAPRFDQPVAPGSYLWWYLDALSDDGAHGLTIIAFVGSVFSSYYAWAQRQQARGGPPALADNHCCINVALYGKGTRRWTMTERGQRHVQRSASTFSVGPSSLRWDGQSLLFDLHEMGVPLPRRVDGTVRVWPRALSRFNAPLDDAGRHRWGPIAPCSRVEVKLDRPGLSWTGGGYLDSNEGDEPIERPFAEWDWSRGVLADGSTAVIYDVRQKQGADRLITQRFYPDGRSEAFEPPPRQALPRTAWRIARSMRTDVGMPARVHQTLEDTPFYVRSVLQSGLFGESVTSVHESLDCARLVSLPVRLMLPWRMPRRP